MPKRYATSKLFSPPKPSDFKESKATPEGYRKWVAENSTRPCRIRGCTDKRGIKSLLCAKHGAHQHRTGDPVLKNVSPASSLRMRKLILRMFTVDPNHAGLRAALGALHSMVRFKKRYAGGFGKARSANGRTQAEFPATSRVFASDSRVDPVTYLAHICGHALVLKIAHPFAPERYLAHQLGNAAHRFARQVPIDSPYGPLYRRFVTRDGLIEGKELWQRLDGFLAALQEAFALTKTVRADLATAWLPATVIAAMEYEPDEPEAPKPAPPPAPLPAPSQPSPDAARVREALARLRAKSNSNPPQESQ